MNSGKVALGVVAAAATGAVLGVLFAPAKGAALRRKIHRMSEQEMDVIKEKVGEVADNLSHKFDKVKDNITDFAHKTMNKTEEVKTAEGN